MACHLLLFSLALATLIPTILKSSCSHCACSGFKRKANHAFNLSNPTAGITCPHNRLKPDLLGGKAKRAPVSFMVWEYILSCVAESRLDSEQKAAAEKRVADDAAVARRVSE